MSTNGQPAPGSLHPIFRCEFCGGWKHRNGETACPPCPHCSWWKSGHEGKKKLVEVSMWPAVRKVPEPVEGRYEA